MVILFETKFISTTSLAILDTCVYSKIIEKNLIHTVGTSVIANKEPGCLWSTSRAHLKLRSLWALKIRWKNCKRLDLVSSGTKFGSQRHFGYCNNWKLCCEDYPKGKHCHSALFNLCCNRSRDVQRPHLDYRVIQHPNTTTTSDNRAAVCGYSSDNICTN